MTPGEIAGLGTLALAVITALCTSLWKRQKAAEERGFERARNEALVREANATVEQMKRESGIKDTMIASLQDQVKEERLHREEVEAQRDHATEQEIPRLHRRIDMLQGTIDRLTPPPPPTR